MTNATIREVYAWHSWSKLGKITGKFGIKFCKIMFLRFNDQII